MELTENQVLAIKRKRGECNYTTTTLSKVTGVNRHTLTDILKNNHRNVNKTTFIKLNEWLIDEMVKDGE